jgi:hypothetical protein
MGKLYGIGDSFHTAFPCVRDKMGSRTHSIQLTHAWQIRWGPLLIPYSFPPSYLSRWESCMEWILDPILSVTHGEAVWNESWTPSYLSRMGKLVQDSFHTAFPCLTDKMGSRTNSIQLFIAWQIRWEPHLICHAWGNYMEWVLDPILSVTHGKAVWNVSWTQSYLSRMGKLYGMSPVTLCCTDWINWFQESKIRAFVNYHWHSLGPHIICSPGAYKANHTVTTNVVYFWISVTVSRIHSIQCQW